MTRNFKNRPYQLLSAATTRLPKTAVAASRRPDQFIAGALGLLSACAAMTVLCAPLVPTTDLTKSDVPKSPPVRSRRSRKGFRPKSASDNSTPPPSS
jgi:hypothetical protein